MWPAGVVELERGIAAARARFGDGPYLIVVQARSLDVDGASDTLQLVSSHARLADARAELDRVFARELEELRDGHDWLDAPPRVVVAVEPGHGVRVVDERGLARADPGGFSAESCLVQLLEIAPPPVIGEALFRALRHAPELALHLARYR